MAQIVKLKCAVDFIIKSAYYNRLFKNLVVLSADPCKAKLHLDESLCNKQSEMDAGAIMTLVDITSGAYCMARGCKHPLSFTMNVR